MTLQAKDDSCRMDDMWELLLLSMIGEYLDDGAGDGKDNQSQVSCARWRVAVWFRSALFLVS